MKRLFVMAAITAIVALGASSLASADTSSRPCTIGDAQANFQAPYPGHLIQGLGVCQYRLFFDGATFTFCEGDLILGGVVSSWEYQALGITRKEGISELKRFGDRVWLDGVEEPLKSTGFKDGLHPLTGDHVVYMQRAFIKRFSAGHHVSYYEGTTDGVVDFTATIDLNILPLTDPSCS